MSAEAQGNFSGKRLVIFGAGYVGLAVASEAVRRGMQVTALTRNPEKALALRDRGVATVVADLASNEWHQQIPGAADFVLNCVNSGGGGVAGYDRSYLGGMRSIIEWAQANGPVNTLVYTSSTSVYPQSGGVRVDETATTNTNEERARVLLATEETLRAAASIGSGDTGTNSTGRKAICRRYFILRLAGIYGPGRHHLLEQVKSGEIAGHGEHRLNLVHRDDICAAIWLAFAAPAEIKNEIFNVADDGAATKAEITGWVASRLGLAAPRFTGIAAVGRRASSPDRLIANDKLKRLLGWRPRYPSYREGYENLLSR